MTTTATMCAVQQRRQGARVVWLCVWLLLASLFGACSGGGGDAAIAPPQITAAPAAAASADDGASATFSVTASGDGLRFQWQKNGADVAGATGASYTLSPAPLADNGSRWRVVVSNDGGSVTSSETVLAVRAVAPRITAAPADATVTASQTATFSATAAGSAPLAYQWLRAGVAISGATASSYTTPATVVADIGATFSVRVSNAQGSVTSAAAALTVNASLVAPTIAAQPQSASVLAGQSASFSVTASGSAPLAYQWRRNGVPIAGATAASYTTPATVAGDSGAAFSVVVSNSAGSVTSSAAALTVATPPQASGQARLSFGNNHVVAVRADGSVIAWGSNVAGQLGNGAAIAGTNARAVATTAVAVAAGGFESLALGTDGIVRGWGRKFGSTTIIGGDAANSGTDVPSPAPAAYPGGVTHLVTGTGNGFGVVRRSDGTVWHLPGVATPIAGGFSQAPRQVPGLSDVAALGGGAGSTGELTAIRADGSVWQVSILAQGAGNWQASAAPISGLTGVVAASCNGFACIALTATGNVVLFGSFGGGAPAVVNGLPTIRQIATTGTGLLAVDTTGRLWRWNSGGTPAQVAGLTDVLEVAGGLETVLVRRADGSVWGYGPNSFGELGTGTPATTVPVQVPGINLN